MNPTVRKLSARTLVLLNKATRATERVASNRTSRTVQAEQDAWDAYGIARRNEMDARRAFRRS